MKEAKSAVESCDALPRTWGNQCARHGARLVRAESAGPADASTPLPRFKGLHTATCPRTGSSEGADT
eukprot:3284737-Pleurochrysis_carterae.AAC.2